MKSDWLEVAAFLCQIVFFSVCIWGLVKCRQIDADKHIRELEIKHTLK